MARVESGQCTKHNNYIPQKNCASVRPCSYELGTEGTGIEAARHKLSAVLPRFHVMLTTYEVGMPCCAMLCCRLGARSCCGMLVQLGGLLRLSRTSVAAVDAVMQRVQQVARQQQRRIPSACPSG